MSYSYMTRHGRTPAARVPTSGIVFFPFKDKVNNVLSRGSWVLRGKYSVSLLITGAVFLQPKIQSRSSVGTRRVHGSLNIQGPASTKSIIAGLTSNSTICLAKRGFIVK
jgi:hypothetical protein